MRKSDKKLNIVKTNLLAEQRYLESKGIIIESFHNPDGTPIGVDINHMPIVNESEELQRGDEIVWVAPPREIDRLLRVMTGAKGEYIGRETSGEWVVEFGSKRFYANDFEFKRANQGQINEE